MHLDRVFWSIASLLLLGILVFFHTRGITYYDEGYILNAALRTAHGEIPYRDFDMVYTPISFIFTSGFLRLFGESVLAGRLAALTLSCMSLIAIYLLLKLFTKNTVLIFGTLLFFVSWGPTHINFPWPTMFALCFLLYAAYFYLAGALRQSPNFFFIAGIMAVLVFLSKQNFGTGTILILLVMLPFLKITNIKKYLVSFILGAFSVSVGYLIFLISTSSLVPLMQNMYLYTLKRVFIDKSLETPFLYEGAIYMRIAKTIFYISPLLIAITAFTVLPKSKKLFIILPFLTAMFYLLGIRPTTDYVHAVSLIALSCVPLALIITFVKRKRFQYAALGLLIGMTVLGFYTAYFKGYYQWEPPLYYASTFVTDKRVGVFLNDVQRDDIKYLVGYIQSQTTPDEYIFVNYYAPLIYFIADRKNPTPYDLISANQLPMSYQEGIVTTLQEKNIKIVLQHQFNDKENSLVAKYTKKNFQYKKTIAGYLIYQRR